MPVLPDQFRSAGLVYVWYSNIGHAQHAMRVLTEKSN